MCAKVFPTDSSGGEMHTDETSPLAMPNCAAALQHGAFDITRAA